MARVGMLMERALTKEDVLRSLQNNIQQFSFDTGADELVYAASAAVGKDTLTVECTNGAVVEFNVKVRA